MRCGAVIATASFRAVPTCSSPTATTSRSGAGWNDRSGQPRLVVHPPSPPDPHQALVDERRRQRRGALRRTQRPGDDDAALEALDPGQRPRGDGRTTGGGRAAKRGRLWWTPGRGTERGYRRALDSETTSDGPVVRRAWTADGFALVAQRWLEFESERRQGPDRPPDFSQRARCSIVIVRSDDLHMS